MKNVCKFLAIGNLVLGSIGSFLSAKTQGMSLNSDFEAVRSWPLTLAVFFAGFVGVVAISVVLYAIYEILGNQERILKRIETSESNMINSNSVPADSWKCGKCGVVNSNYTGTCSCGASKNDFM